MNEDIKQHLQKSVQYAIENDEDMNAVSWGMQEGVLISYNDAVAILNSIEKIEKLEAWKREALLVMPDMQAIGKALNVRLGESVHDKILPEILRLKGLIELAYKAGEKRKTWIYHGQGMPPTPPDLQQFKTTHNL